MRSKYIHPASCRDQMGMGLPTYKGTPYQLGYGVYRGQTFQRGFGLGGSLGNYLRATLSPVLSRAKSKLFPAVKTIGQKAANRAGRSALNVGMDVALNRKNAKQATRAALADLVMASKDDVLKEVQTLLPDILQLGRGGVARPRKRKHIGQGKKSYKKRKTIFD